MKKMLFVLLLVCSLDSYAKILGEKRINPYENRLDESLNRVKFVLNLSEVTEDPSFNVSDAANKDLEINVELSICAFSYSLENPGCMAFYNTDMVAKTESVLPVSIAFSDQDAGIARVKLLSMLLENGLEEEEIESLDILVRVSENSNELSAEGTFFYNYTAESGIGLSNLKLIEAPKNQEI